MAADPIIYCLENLSDYAEFERLCSDLMANERYDNIEPLGGTRDKGRDALHVNRKTPHDVTIFAYSVREDWRKKLFEDADKIKKHKHKCMRLVFICTASIKPTERDNTIFAIKGKYGWNLELYDLERLRVNIVKNEHLISKHPQIFNPSFFPNSGGVSQFFYRNYIVIDHAESEEALATWLTKRLAMEGYYVWCRSTAPTAGRSLNELIEELTKQRAFCFITILSPNAVNEPNITARRNFAISLRTNLNMFLPIVAAKFDEKYLDSKVQELAKIYFDTNWQKGLDELLQSLEAKSCPKKEGGKRIALRSFFPQESLSNKHETLYSNRFPVLTIPEVIHRFRSKVGLSDEDNLKYAQQWSFRKVDPSCFLSLHHPPDRIKYKLGIYLDGGCCWQHEAEINGIPTDNLITGLLKKALKVSCINRGLKFCEDTYLLYFPLDLLRGNRLYFIKPNGLKSYLSTVGRRKYWTPKAPTEYMYHLAPVFSVQRSCGHDNDFYIVVRIKVRLTYSNGILLDKRTALSRRKHLCKDWWNNDWFHRILAVMQFLGNGNNIKIGESKSDTITIKYQPDKWIVPISIDENSLKKASTMRKEALKTLMDYEEDDYNEDKPKGTY